MPTEQPDREALERLAERYERQAKQHARDAHDFAESPVSVLRLNAPELAKQAAEKALIAESLRFRLAHLETAEPASDWRARALKAEAWIERWAHTAQCNVPSHTVRSHAYDADAEREPVRFSAPADQPAEICFAMTEGHCGYCGSRVRAGGPVADRCTHCAPPAVSYGNAQPDEDSAILDRLLARCKFYFNGIRVRTHDELTAALDGYVDGAPAPEVHVIAAREEESPAVTPGANCTVLPNFLNVSKTDRGFHIARFTDWDGARCSLQQSSRAVGSAVWLGVDGMRIHLTRDMVVTLIPTLCAFAHIRLNGPVSMSETHPEPKMEPVALAYLDSRGQVFLDSGMDIATMIRATRKPVQLYAASSPEPSSGSAS